MTPTTSNSSTTRDYRFEHPRLSMILSDMRIPAEDPGPGDSMPALVLETADGRRIDRASIEADGRPLLLVFGSLTCPITESAGAGLRELHARYGEAVRFLLVTVREAHPGKLTPQPSSMAEKRRHAELLGQHHELPFEVAVDDIEGTTHQAFGTRPSSAYVIDPNHTIVFRAQWSNASDALEQALASVVAGRQPEPSDVTQTLRALATSAGYATATFSTAGKGAWADMWRAAPPGAAMLALSGRLGFVPRERRGWLAMAAMGIITAAAVAFTAAALW